MTTETSNITLPHKINLKDLPAGPLYPHISSGVEIKALSIKQPYAKAILFGKPETRTWRTHYRGLVLICSTKTRFPDKEIKKISGDFLYKNMIRTISKAYPDHDKDSYAIAIADLVDCRMMRKKDEHISFVKHQLNLFCHIYENVRPIEPFLWHGVQNFRRLKEEEKQKIILL